MNYPTYPDGNVRAGEPPRTGHFTPGSVPDGIPPSEVVWDDVEPAFWRSGDHVYFEGPARGETSIPLIPTHIPEIVVLCGSTRFSEAFQQANRELTMSGRIVLSIGVDTKSDDELEITEADKRMLNELHKRKIDLADRVYVLNVDGYIGSSTRSEIDYAYMISKPVLYLVHAPGDVTVPEPRLKPLPPAENPFDA